MTSTHKIQHTVLAQPCSTCNRSLAFNHISKTSGLLLQ